MQIIFGEKCVLLLRLFFAAVLMLWCAQTAAYSGQCHTTQGNPYIGVNFGVKTLEEEENTAGVVKTNFISGTNRMIIMFPVIAIKTMSEVADGHSPRIHR